MMEQSSSTHRKYLKYQEPLNPSITMMIMDMKHMAKKRILLKKLISLSRLPILDLGILLLMFDLVSLPLYTTSP